MKNISILTFAVFASLSVTACSTVENTVPNFDLANPGVPVEKDKTNEYVVPAEPMYQEAIENTADYPAYKK